MLCRPAMLLCAVALSFPCAGTGARAQSKDLPCESFQKNPDGSWAALNNAAIPGTGGSLTIRQGSVLRPGAIIRGQDLAAMLRRALGPTGIKGFSGAGKLNQLTLFPDSEDSDAIDGLAIESDDTKVQMLHTARVLVENWLRLHKETLVNYALPMGTKDPIKQVLF